MKKIKAWLQMNKIRLFYSFILLVVFISFIVLAFTNVGLKRVLPLANINLNPIDFNPQAFPQLQNTVVPYVTAQGVIIMDRDSQVPLYEKNPTLRFSPASTTKIMTALIALEHYKMDDLLTIYDGNVNGSTINLTKNEVFRFEDLLYAMMLPSANDATAAIAQNYPGGQSAFVAKMNEKAKQLGLENTHFADPIGLMDDNDYTTPLDLARLSSVAMQSPDFAKVVSTKERIIKNTEGKDYKLENLNVLLNLPGVNGIKTGFTEEAGQVLVTGKKIPGTNKEIIVVVMQSTDRFGDSEALLNFLDNNVTYLSIHP